jgi:hypothetical protein
MYTRHSGASAVYRYGSHLRRSRRSRGPSLRRPVGSNMGLSQTAVNTLSYSIGSRSKAEAGRASAKRIGTGACGLRLGQRSSGPLGGGWPTARIGFVGAEPAASRFPADRRGDQDVVGSHLITTLFSLRLRVAQHFTHRLAAET